MSSGLGAWAGVLFAIGLFCAGLSSAITAPLASALTASSLASGDASGRWGSRGAGYRAVWVGVLAVGLVFGLSGVRPVPVIILAQALNGVLLPAVAVFLLVAVNDRRLMGERGLNGWLSNTLMVLVTLVALLLGCVAIARVLTGLAGAEAPSLRVILLAVTLIALAVAGPLVRLVRRRRAPFFDTST